MPYTPLECVKSVAGKVIQIENLQDDIDMAQSFNRFFANVYCSAYTNSLLTLKDGLSQIFPGGLDYPIESELRRIGGSDKIDIIEVNLTMLYLYEVQRGKFARDDSMLIEQVKPLDEAIELCGNYVYKNIAKAS